MGSPPDSRSGSGCPGHDQCRTSQSGTLRACTCVVVCSLVGRVEADLPSGSTRRGCPSCGGAFLCPSHSRESATALLSPAKDTELP